MIRAADSANNTGVAKVILKFPQMTDTIAHFEELLKTAPRRLVDVSDDAAAHKPAPNRWSKKEILGHLIDSAGNNHQRFVRAQTVDPFVWPGYDQQFWVSVHRYRDRPWAELVELWVGLNCHVAQIIEGVPPVRLSARCVIGDAEPATLEWWMRDYLRHLRHHLAQIEGD